MNEQQYRWSWARQLAPQTADPEIQSVYRVAYLNGAMRGFLTLRDDPARFLRAISLPFGDSMEALWDIGGAADLETIRAEAAEIVAQGEEPG